jgi:hypothetical protein
LLPRVMARGLPHGVTVLKSQVFIFFKYFLLKYK